MRFTHSTKLVLTLVGTACSVCSAQNTQLIFEASNTQGQSWSPALTVQPGETVYVRLRIRLTNQGTTTVLGLGGLTHDPKLSPWNSIVDECLPFTDPINPVPEEPQTNTGRIMPFAAGGLGTSTPTPPLGCYVDGNALHFVPRRPDPQTSNLAWGISSGQTPPSSAGTNFHYGTDAVVFRYSVRVGDSGAERDLIATQDLSGLVGTRASWYRTDGGTRSLLTTIRPEDIFPATIHVLPTPGALGACAIGSYFLTSRRRRV